VVEREYYCWCASHGYTTITDWGYQSIGDCNYYWLLNPKTSKFALIKHSPSFDGYTDTYEVLVDGWTDFNGYAEAFHEETSGIYK